jgi:multicomponent Na+:H+ antiporter subunit F
MSYMEFSIIFALVLLCLSLLLMVIRLIIGPSLEDRVIALDLVMTTGIAAIAVYSLVTRSKTVLDVGIIIALLSFLGTVAFAFYLERRSLK